MVLVCKQAETTEERNSRSADQLGGKRMAKLPCDNLTDFINGMKHFYSVGKSDYREGQQVILYNNQQEEVFEIVNVMRFKEYDVLGIKYKENAE